MADPSVIFKRLLKKHMEGIATENEETALRLMWHLFDDEEIAAFIEELGEDIPLKLPKRKTDSAATAAAVLSKAKEKEATKQKRVRRLVAGWAAACILLVVGVWITRLISEKRQYNVACDSIAGQGEIITTGYNCTIKDGEISYNTDSSTKVLLRYNNLVLVQQPGKIIYRSATGTGDTRQFSGHQISTGPEEQYLVALPDSTLLRMNAQTVVKIGRDTATGMLKAELVRGELFVENRGVTTLTAPNAIITSRDGHFNIRAIQGGSWIAVTSGNLEARATAGEQVDLGAGEISALLKVRYPGFVKDTMITERNVDVAAISTWKNVTRIYDKVPLAEFVQQMQYWYGIHFDNLDCLPHRTISTLLCYRASRDDFFAVLRHNGITVHQTSKGYTFCNPTGLKQWNQLAWQH